MNHQRHRRPSAIFEKLTKFTHQFCGRAFHFAFKISDIASTRSFYVDLLGCTEGRSTDTWIDVDFFGNQLSAHVSIHRPELDYCGLVDDVSVPIPHFGCLLTEDQFTRLEQKLRAADYKFIVEPQVRYAGQTGQQRTMFILDPSNNPMMQPHGKLNARLATGDHSFETK